MKERDKKDDEKMNNENKTKIDKYFVKKMQIAISKRTRYIINIR